jgi:hypothetical protein
MSRIVYPHQSVECHVHQGGGYYPHIITRHRVAIDVVEADRPEATRLEIELSLTRT